jgi:hypothetical protein
MELGKKSQRCYRAERGQPAPFLLFLARVSRGGARVGDSR